MPFLTAGLNLMLICVDDLTFVLVNIMYEKFWNSGVCIVISTKEIPAEKQTQYDISTDSTS